MMEWPRSSGVGNGHELLPELLGQSFESTLFGLQDLSVVVGQALLDIVVALDHDAPVPGGEPACRTASRLRFLPSGVLCLWHRG